MNFGTSAIFLVIVLISTISAFSSEEQSALEKLRPLVSDVLYRDYMQEDVYLIQWLRTIGLDLDKANQAIRKAHAWRQEKNIDAILDEDWSKFDKEFPFSLAGHDKEGRPLMYMNYGPAWDFRKAVLKGQQEKVVRHLTHMFELSATKARETFNVTVPTATGARDVPDWTTIHDLTGYTLRKNGCLGCIPPILSYVTIVDKYLAYSVKNVYSVNTPRIFENILQLIRNAISEHTNKIFKVYGNDRREFLEQLSTVISPDQLKLHFKI